MTPFVVYFVGKESNMKAKKVLTSMLFACVACLACFSFVACAEPALSNVHTHDYTWTVTKEATCESDGSRHGVCACGVETDEVLPKLDHDYGDWVASKRPTPTENGTAKRVCKANPAHVEEKSLPKATVDSYEISTDDNGLVLDYVYKDDPDITFKAYDVSTVAKAVQVAALTDPLAVGGTINVKSETLAGRNDKNAALPTDQADRKSVV